MADLPKGRITGRFMHITADSEDGDANPDFTPAPVAFMVPTDGVVDLSVPIPALPEQPAIVAVSYVDASQAIAANATAQEVAR